MVSPGPRLPMTVSARDYQSGRACGTENLVVTNEARRGTRRAHMTTPATPPAPENKMGGLPPIDVNEYGGKKDGERQVMNRRLFMQLLVFDVPEGGDAGETGRDLFGLLREDKIPGVVYADTMAPRGL